MIQMETCPKAGVLIPVYTYNSATASGLFDTGTLHGTR
jgi:hypothetical protein